MTEEGRIVSTREGAHKINNGPVQSPRNRAGENGDIFATPVTAEGVFVSAIYSTSEFQKNIERQKTLKDGVLAGPFLVAKASVIEGTVVTFEKFRENAVRIPNIYNRFDIECMNLEEFMEEEGWMFK